MSEHSGHAHHPGSGSPVVDPNTDPVEFWEGRYGEKDAIWSGRANRGLVDAFTELAGLAGRGELAQRAADGSVPTALDLGSGEGGDAIWLAERGFHVTGVELSPTAVARATRAAAERGLGGRTVFVTADLASWTTAEQFDLVTGCFLQSPLHFPRTDILRRSAALVAPGGYLLSVGHAAPPPWSPMANDPEVVFPSPESDLADLALDDGWEVLIAQVRTRDATGPDGQHAPLDDSVVLVRRR